MPVLTEISFFQSFFFFCERVVCSPRPPAWIVVQHPAPEEEHRELLKKLLTVKEMHIPPGTVLRIEFIECGSMFFVLRYVLQKQFWQKYITVV